MELSVRNSTSGSSWSMCVECDDDLAELHKRVGKAAGLTDGFDLVHEGEILGREGPVCCTPLTGGCTVEVVIDPEAQLRQLYWSVDFEGFHGAVEREDMDLVALYLKVLGTSCKDARGRTPLHGANSAAMVGLLVGAGMDVNNMTKTCTPLSEAVARNSLSTIQALLDWGADVNLSTSVLWYPRHPLGRAVYLGLFDVVRLLLDRGAAICGSDLGFAATLVTDTTMLRMLLDRGADVNVEEGRALSSAVRHVNPKAVALLLDAGAVLSFPLKLSRSFPTSFFDEQQRQEAEQVMYMLLEAGMSVDGSHSPWLLARGAGISKDVLTTLLLLLDSDSDSHFLLSRALTCALDSVSAVRCLLEAGADASPDVLMKSSRRWSNKKCLSVFSEFCSDLNVVSKGWTLLAAAVCHHDKSTIAALLDAGADPNWTCGGTAASPLFVLETCDSNDYQLENLLENLRLIVAAGGDVNSTNRIGETPLFFAARKGCADFCQMLLESGARVDACNPNGETPLLLATSRGHKQVVVHLLEAGADPLKVDSDGRTPLSLAQDRNQKSITRLLNQALRWR